MNTLKKKTYPSVALTFMLTHSSDRLAISYLKKIVSVYTYQLSIDYFVY